MDSLNLRIIHTHDTESNWNLCTEFVPKAGELIVYDVDDHYDYVRFKIGDGINTINDLPFNIDTTIEYLDAFRYVGVIEESEQLPAANKGDVYKIVFDGKIGDRVVERGDILICNTDNTPENTENNWDIVQSNVDVDAILDHYHTGDLLFTTSDKTLEHKIKKTTAQLEASYVDGTSTVVADHKHNAEGSVTIKSSGQIDETELTPKGLVKLSIDVAYQENDVTVRPSGTISEESTVTDVVPDNTTISSHVASLDLAGDHTPQGVVDVDSETISGEVEKHSHNVGVSPLFGKFFDKVTYSEDSLGGVLTFGLSSSVTSLSVSEDDVSPKFTATEHSHKASFTGSPVEGHVHNITIEDHEDIVPNISVTKDIHKHIFTGEDVHIHGEFIGSPESHKHDFIGDAITEDVSINVHEFSGNFSGTSEGKVIVTVPEVLTDVDIDNHQITTVDSGRVVTGSGIEN